MKLKDLFWMQRELDKHIVEEQGLKEAPFNERILGFIVELGECANEWKEFKYWKVPEKRIPNTRDLREPAMMPEDQIWYNPMLEEYVDLLHFVLSLGITLKTDKDSVKTDSFEHWKADTLTEQFIAITGKTYDLYKYKDKHTWHMVFRMFVALGEMLGFTWDQVEAAYFEKNSINHARQVTGY